jgi:hypothetical protein
MIATVWLPLLYLIFRHVLGPSLTSRTCATREDELVMLPHEVAMLRRANPKSRTYRADRAVFAASSGFEDHPGLGCVRADQPATMPTTRLIVVARMTVPKT